MRSYKTLVSCIFGHYAQSKNKWDAEHHLEQAISKNQKLSITLKTIFVLLTSCMLNAAALGEGAKHRGGSPFPVDGYPAIFNAESAAQKHCPKDSVVWLDLQSGLYQLKGSGTYGRTKTGTYACRDEADIAGDHIDIFTDFLIEWVRDFCSVYKPPPKISDCHPVYKVTYLNGAITNFEVVASCGAEVDDAVHDAMRTSPRPRLRLEFLNLPIEAMFYGNKTPDENSCSLVRSVTETK